MSVGQSVAYAVRFVTGIAVSMAILFINLRPGRWDFVEFVFVEIRRVLFLLARSHPWDGIEPRYPTSSFVIGRPFAWKAGTFAFLTGFSLSLYHGGQF